MVLSFDTSSGLSATLLAGEKLDNPLSMYLGDLMTVCILINTCYSLESLFKGLGFKHRCTHKIKCRQIHNGHRWDIDDHVTHGD